MIGFLSGIWSRIWEYVVIVGAAVGILYGAYVKGSRDQRQDSALKEAKKRVDTIKKGQEIDQDVSKRSPDDLDRSISRWLRDGPKT